MATGPAQKIPTTELIGPAGRIVVNTVDVSMYTSKGYRDANAPTLPSTSDEVPPATSDEAPPATPPVAPPAQDQTPKTANSGPGKAKAIS